MPRLLAAEVVAALAHGLDDVAVAHAACAPAGPPCAWSARSRPRLLMTVATTVFLRSSWSRSMRRAHMAMTASPSTIWPFSSITMTRSASPSRAMPMWAPRRRTSAARVLGVHGPALAVDVGAVRLHPDGEDLGAQLLEDEGGHAVGGAVGGIHHDAHAVEGEVAREGGLGEGHVAAPRVLELLGPADGRARSAASPRRWASAIRPSISASASSGSLKPSPPKTLMPLSAIGIVAGADHDAGVGAHADGEVGDRRAWARGRTGAPARPSSRCPRRSRSRSCSPERRVSLPMMTRGACCLPAARDVGDGPPEGQRQLGGDGRLVGHAPDAVGAEEGACRVRAMMEFSLPCARP